MPAAELILDVHAQLAEGPVWLASANELVWVNCAAAEVHWLDHATGKDRVLNVGAQVGVALPDSASGLMLALPEGIARLAAGSTVPEYIVRFGHESDMCLNDGACDRQGRLWVGSISYDEAPERGSLYRVDPDLQFERVLDRLWISNGIDWSLDNTLMYYVDSPTKRVDVLDYDIATGAATNRRPFHTFADDDPGIPDGLCVDAEGGLWVAMWGGSRVVGLAPDGTVHTQVDVASSQVTSCAFGGPDLKTLFITSATFDLAPEVLEQEPHAGGLFAADVGVAGRLPTPFAG
jgi:sugar lactone lactonase YvrE